MQGKFKPERFKCTESLVEASEHFRADGGKEETRKGRGGASVSHTYGEMDERIPLQVAQ